MSTRKETAPETNTCLRLRDILFDGNTFSAATEIIRTHIETKLPLAHRSTPSILLHASSNGGANNTSTLASLLRRQGYAAPFDAITLDCSPGKAEFHSGARAIRLSLPNVLFFRTWSIVFIYLALILYRLVNFVLSRTDTITRIRHSLNDRALMGVNVPRLYLYSRADVVVEAGHVREHAEEARGKGCGKVVEEVFESAPHCALVNEDRERYWAVVERHARAEKECHAESWFVRGR